ncbi:MAG: PKD domain-containing protein [Methanosarcina sp.]
MENILVDVNQKKETKKIKLERRKFIFCFLSTFLLFCLLISPATAKVDWKLTPASPTVGDLIKIRGTATPDETIQGEISFEMDLPVSKGKYQYILKDIQVPEGFDNIFTVQAEGVKDLHVGVKKFVCINLNVMASNGVATISQGHVPPLSYKVIIDGNSLEGKSSVHLKFTASQNFKADSKGKFKYSYDTSSIPAGLFKIKIGGLEQIVELKAKEQKPVADFCANPRVGKAPLKVAFKDLSTGNPVEWKWNFGDGTSSTEKNPTHTYKKAGKYTVILKVKNSAFSNTITKSYYIVVEKAAGTKKAPVASFSASPKFGKTPLEVQFVDKSKNSPYSWKWTFGDGTSSTEKSPVHTYKKVGEYTVTLKVKNSAGVSKLTKSDYITVSRQF